MANTPKNVRKVAKDNVSFVKAQSKSPGAKKTQTKAKKAATGLAKTVYSGTDKKGYVLKNMLKAVPKGKKK